MTDSSSTDTQPRMRPSKPPAKRRSVFNLDTLLGFVIGLLLSLLSGFALWGLGLIGVPGEGCPEVSIEEICSATVEALPTITQTPTPTATSTSTSTPTPTASLTATPDLAATATAACIEFESQFPATPCP